MPRQPPLRVASYNAASGLFNTWLPFRGLKFGSGLNGQGGTFNGTLDLKDSKVRAKDPINATIPGKTLLVVDYQGQILEGYWVTPRHRQKSDQTLTISGAPQAFAYFTKRGQVADYSAPPNSSLQPGGMTYWTAQPFDAGLVLAQVFSDVLSYRWSYNVGAVQDEYVGAICNAIQILYNGQVPSGSNPQIPSSNYVGPTFPLSSVQPIGSIAQQLTGYGYLTGIDFNFKLSYAYGNPGDPLVGTLNISYPRAGRTAAQSKIVLNGKLSREATLDEDAMQQGTTIIETGIQGALLIYDNIYPLAQGWPIIDQIMSHSGGIGPNLVALLLSAAKSDSFLYSFPPVAPVVRQPFAGTGASDLTKITPGDDCYWREDPQPILPNGFTAPGAEFRIVQWDVTRPERGDIYVDYTLNLPPAATATAPVL